ncbi:hypothetical protein Asppvi_000599 [Aspergillus pseudoviridinutans]|uniref:MACPF-like domain-containing protein n=1 Tax=Aspergillus pseudoviridinutans TaxID=1517512 RepID=A0A9P3B147_9EURO|nr:uncharacterized protein Asppvi_000599 [Aspergillus pseudoviridinutans]GIJ82096.1 hypothetical protein Asppvi_000599 [Aspergillus pseudoviridinutans]
MGENSVILAIQKYDVQSGSSSPISRAVLPQKFNAAALEHIRCVKNKFCDKDGAEVAEDTTFDVYVQMNKEPDGNAYNLFFLAAGSAAAGMDADTTAFLKERVDLSLSDRMPFLNPALAKLTSSIKKDDWKASAGKADTYAADMNEQQWGIVIRNNDLLNGKFFEGGGTNDKLQVPTSIRRARHTAFALKERAIPEYNITFQVAKPPPAQLKQPELKFRIPRFQICDSSRVEVFETKTSIADSMAANAFSQTTVEAAAGGGAFGVSVGVKAGATTSESSSYAQSSSKDESRMHVAYLFPRVEVFLDVEDLELTEECIKQLQKLRHANAKKEDADNFFHKFGHVFVPHVQLGGRLYSVESTSSIAGSTTQEKASALKAAASASVSGFGFQASVSASHETTKDEKVERSHSSSSHSITWHADGGDTLLCNNPPAWCPTVHSYYNWRVMNQIGMVDIVQLIGKMDGWKDIPGVFEAIYFSRVPFLLDQFGSGAATKAYLGMIANEELLERPEAGGGNFSRRAKRHLLTKSQTGDGHMKADLEVYALRHQLVWEGEKGTTPRYPLRVSFNKELYSVRRTTLAEHYQNENVLYAGLNEDANILITFNKMKEDPGNKGKYIEDREAAERADKIGSHDFVRLDFYDIQSREHLGWLQNNPGVAVLRKDPGVTDFERAYRFRYL